MLAGERRNLHVVVGVAVNLKFHWHMDEIHRIWLAECEGSAFGEHGRCAIADLLTHYHSGGILSPTKYAEWVADAISEFDAVKAGEPTSGFWATDIVTAIIEPDVVTLHTFLYDKEHIYPISASDFRRVLVAWRQFLLDGPRDGAEMQIEISII